MKWALQTKTVLAAWVALAAVGSRARPATAQPSHLEPGSALVFPIFDSRPESATVISVTNLNSDRIVCDNGARLGDVEVHYVYYGQDPRGGVCLEFDRFEPLTPGDTLSVKASDHNPEMEVGFLSVRAVDPETQAPIVFNHLIGSAFVANSELDLLWSYTPYAFEGLGAQSKGDDRCGRAFIYDETQTSTIQFDGIDYAAFPDLLLLDSFVEEEEGLYANALTLMSTAGQDYIHEVDFFFFNNQEDKFSRNFKFVCHTTLQLSEISAIARNLMGDPSEFVRETGWVMISDRDVLDGSGNTLGFSQPLLAVFMQAVRTEYTAGHALHFVGEQATRLPLLGFAPGT